MTNFMLTENVAHPERWCAHCENDGLVVLDQERPVKERDPLTIEWTQYLLTPTGHRKEVQRSYSDSPAVRVDERDIHPAGSSNVVAAPCPMCERGGRIDMQLRVWLTLDPRDYTWNRGLTIYHRWCRDCRSWKDPAAIHHCLADPSTSRRVDLDRLSGAPAAAASARPARIAMQSFALPPIDDQQISEGVAT